MVEVPSCPGDCLLPACLDQLHLVIEVRVVLGGGDQRSGQLDPVAAGAHDPHRRHYARTRGSIHPIPRRARSRRMRSVARFRAVLINQARGLLGDTVAWPSVGGHRERLLRIDQGGPHSSRKTCSSVATNTPPRGGSRRRHHSVLLGRGRPPRWPRRGRRPRG